ncbi:type VI secretion system-associated protein VasI [Marinomonas sp. FW-1]|uniref:type VI secretion system-associated protein VasI n=1 Tax=Marinomonas sp. FW-1 TaxID=2071621 RepID=UPI0010C1273E|nr:type VI secretion system-associated protein VasI [Marinomonas sp. FW-1]
MIRYLLLLVICLQVSTQVFANNNDSELLKKAARCTEEAMNFARLTCFDEVFSTPAHIPVINDKPDAWLRAKASEMARVGNNDPMLTLDGDDKWITVPAVNKDSGELFPALIFSCINNISRLEMALPNELEDGRVDVTFGDSSAQLWRSDDTGFLISSGRGFIAINQIKTILSSSSLVVRSNSPSIDGLQFNTNKLNDTIKPLRKQCGW